MNATEHLELSDHIVSFDPDRGRTRVRKADVLEKFRQAGAAWGARIAATIPEDAQGYFVDDVVDEMLVEAHRELQRLNEEFQQGPRLQKILQAMLKVVPNVEANKEMPRVVDVGCGIGFIPRWLASESGLAATFHGCDFNPALIEEAKRAAKEESLNAKFEVCDAFRLKEPASIFTSTGVLHHFRGDSLGAFFAQHSFARHSPQANGQAAVGFIHFDIEASWVSPIGAALFHIARMRSALARHDGIQSARRAHTREHLVHEAKLALPNYVVGIFDAHQGLFPLTKVLRAVVGIRNDLEESFRKALGKEERKWRVPVPGPLSPGGKEHV